MLSAGASSIAGVIVATGLPFFPTYFTTLLIVAVIGLINVNFSVPLLDTKDGMLLLPFGILAAELLIRIEGLILSRRTKFIQQSTFNKHLANANFQLSASKALGMTNISRQNAIWVCCLIPFAEELVFRGCWIALASQTLSYTSMGGILVGSCLTYSLLHARFGRIQFVLKFLLSIVLLSLALVAGGLIVPTFVHCYFNYRVMQVHEK
jgi:membrane protease YdiL (CAAX protease family)